MTVPMDVRVENGAAARVVVSGEVDLATADRLREALRDALDSAKPVVVDLGGCTFIDSVGLGVLLDAARRSERGGNRRLGLVSLTAPVKRLIELTQIDSVIPVFDSDDEAASRLLASQAPPE